VVELANFRQTNESEMKGFSDKNIRRINQFYQTYKDFPKLSPAVRKRNNDIANAFKVRNVF
jgi:hypothetical protein